MPFRTASVCWKKAKTNRKNHELLKHSLDRQHCTNTVLMPRKCTRLLKQIHKPESFMPRLESCRGRLPDFCTSFRISRFTIQCSQSGWRLSSGCLRPVGLMRSKLLFCRLEPSYKHRDHRTLPTHVRNIFMRNRAYELTYKLQDYLSESLFV